MAKSKLLQKMLNEIEEEDNSLAEVRATKQVTISAWELNCIIEAFRNIYICFPQIKERKTCLHRLIMRAWHMATCIAKDEKYELGMYSNADLVPSVEPTTTIWTRNDILNEVSSILSDYLNIDENEEVIELLNERLKKTK